MLRLIHVVNLATWIFSAATGGSAGEKQCVEPEEQFLRYPHRLPHPGACRLDRRYGGVHRDWSDPDGLLPGGGKMAGRMPPEPVPGWTHGEHCAAHQPPRLYDPHIAQVGDTLKIEGRAFDGRTFDVEAVVVGTYNRSDLMEDSPVVPGSPYFIMTYDTAKKLTGITEQTGILAIKNSEGCFDEVLTAVQKIADKNEKIEVNTIEQTIKNIQHRYSASINALYMTSAILFVFGSISLMNMLMVDFQNRKREFGLLEAVGVTRKQLKAMLNREIGIYLGGSLAISLICGSIFSVIVCRRLDAINHCITLKLPWFFLLALICVLLVIYLVFSMYSKMELKKASILSAIKSE